MGVTAKLFKHGRSQAVRLPKAFRFDGAEVSVTRLGDRVILAPLSTARDVPWSVIDAIDDGPFMQDGRDQPAMPDDQVAIET